MATATATRKDDAKDKERVAKQKQKDKEQAAKAKEKEKAAKAKEKEQAAKAKEKEKAAKAKEKERLAKQKEKERAAKQKEKERAAKAKEKEKEKAAKAKEKERLAKQKEKERAAKAKEEERAAKAEEKAAKGEGKSAKGTGKGAGKGATKDAGRTTGQELGTGDTEVREAGYIAESLGKADKVTRSTKRPSLAASYTTRDHDIIRAWAESRGGVPADVRGTGDGESSPGVLRIEFRDPADDLEEVSWDAFFSTFDDSDVDFLYQEHTADGSESRFFKIVRADS